MKRNELKRLAKEIASLQIELDNVKEEDTFLKNFYENAIVEASSKVSGKTPEERLEAMVVLDEMIQKYIKKQNAKS
jgi:hypothetical protein